MSEHRISRKGLRAVKGAALLLLLAAGLMGGDPVCAEESEDQSGPEMTVIVGEHGFVDGHGEDYTRPVTGDDAITLELQGDDGYVISEVLVNDEPLEEADMEGIAGEPFADLQLEGIENDLKVEVLFERDETGETDDTDDEEEQDAGELSGDEDPEDPGQEEPAQEAPVNDIPEEEDGDAPADGAGEEAGNGASDPEDAPAGDEEEALTAHSPQTGDSLHMIALLLLSASATLIGIVLCGGRYANRRKERL